MRFPWTGGRKKNCLLIIVESDFFHTVYGRYCGCRFGMPCPAKDFPARRQALAALQNMNPKLPDQGAQ
jgi:hypothetical protein